MTFAEKLRELRLTKKLSQKQLAECVGVAQSAVARWEAGLQIPAFDNVQKLCECFGVKCTAFDGVSYEANDEARPVGRPTKEAETKPAKPTKKGKK